jgi:hypothetical protein
MLERLSEKSAELESVFIEVVLKLKFEYLVSYEVKQCKTISGLTESTDLIF